MARRAAGSSYAQHGRSLSYAIDLPSAPFGIAVTQDDRWVFVGLATTPTGIAVIERLPSGYRVARVVPLAFEADGLALTHDGKLLAATSAGVSAVYFLDVSGLGQGGADPVTVTGSISNSLTVDPINLSSRPTTGGCPLLGPILRAGYAANNRYCRRREASWKGPFRL